jgi:hypothetical protein
MKRTIIFLSLMLVTLGGCKSVNNPNGKTTGADKLSGKATGSGVMKVEKRSVPAFTSVSISGAYDVLIVAQKEQSLEIEGDDNLLSLIKTEVKDGVLDIGNEQGLTTRGKLQVRISTPKLDGISTSGDSDIIITGVKSDAFKIDTSGAGSLQVSGETKTLVAQLSGAGDINAKDLHAESVNLTSSGAANADVYASEELRVNATGAGNVNYYGDPKVVNQESSGVGTITKK